MGARVSCESGRVLIQFPPSQSLGVPDGLATKSSVRVDCRYRAVRMIGGTYSLMVYPICFMSTVDKALSTPELSSVSLY